MQVRQARWPWRVDGDSHQRRRRGRSWAYQAFLAQHVFDRLEPRILLSASIPAVPVPVAHWALDEGAGTTAVDASGNGHTGSLGAGASWVAGNVGAFGVKFNGSSTGVVTATGPVVDTSASFTVSAWVNLAVVSGYQTLVCIAGTNVAGFFLQLRGDSGSFALARLNTDATGGATTISASSAPLANTWYHVVGVNDVAAHTLALYVDGQSMGTANYTASWAATGNTLIGHGFYAGAQTDYVNGSVDDVQFFASALTADQIAALDQPAAYPFDEGAGTVASDYSGNGRSLTLGAGASWTTGNVGAAALAVSGTAAGNAITPAPVVNTALPFSISAWIRLNATGTTQTFASIDGTNVSGFALQYRADSGRFAFTRLASDNSAAAVSHADAVAAPATGVWYNLIGVNDVANHKLLLYVNGLLQSSVTYSGGWQATGATVIGGGKFNGARSDVANAAIDEVRFFNAPLSASAAAYVGTNGGGIVSVNATVSGVTVSPTLFGAFMEDINYGGEGGIYNDEVRNSGFNDASNHLNAWAAVAGSGVVDALASDTASGPTTALTMSGRLTVTSGVSASARAGISNSGYFGVAVAPSTTYTATFYARATAGFTGPLNVTLESTGGTVYASATVPSLTTAWTKYTVTMTTSAGAPTSATNRFVIATNSATANGQSIWFGAAYLYPPSFNNTPAHLRTDLMQKLADLHPAIFRVPGGNYLEGNDYANRFNWSATIGPVENRPGHMDPWGYWSTDGMGLDEYLQMAELAGAQPLLAVYAGYTLNGNSDTGTTLTNDVTDAVNELHYVLDPVSTSWGAMRAANGHAAPYNVNYVEVGNEDFFSSTYPTRYPLFYNAIHAAFPSLKIIATTSSTGGSPYDVLDDHYYNTAQWFESNANLYGGRSRGSNKVFVGEYAARNGSQTSTITDALGDASWLMGLERNSDLVVMSSYAPIWVNVNPGGQQWATDLIGFNNTASFGSASYYAQQMLAAYHGTQVIGSSILGASGLQVLATHTGTTYYLTFVNPGPTVLASTVNLTGLNAISSSGTLVTLAAPSGTASNSIGSPTLIAPVTTTVIGLATHFTQYLPAYSLTILQVRSDAGIPTIASPSAAVPAAVTGTSTSLSVLGADNGGEAGLTYTWSAVGAPPAAVVFASNGSNASKNTVATFSKAGTYTLTVTIADAQGLTANSNVLVTVNQTLTSAAISPATTTVALGGTSQFSLLGTDQFGDLIGTPIQNMTWSVYSGLGSISPSGLFSAPGSGSGVTTLRAIASTGQVYYANADLVSQVAWYAANTSSGTVLVDVTGNGWNGTLSGAAAFAAGVSGNALSLSGGAATLPTGIVSSLADFTIAAWVRLDAIANWARIFDFGTGTNTYMFLAPKNGSTNVVRFAITTSGAGGEQQINGTTALATGSWQHVAVTLAGNTGTLFVNGSAVGSNTAMTLHPSSLGATNQNYLGDSQYTLDPALLGSIDDFRIVGRALSAAEIQALARPSIVSAATASGVNSSSAALSVVGADATGGESSLKYTWTINGTPPAPVVFSANGINAARTVQASFSKAGTYSFLVTVTNNANFSVTSALALTINSSMLARHLFYGGSAFDGATHDNAIPTDKVALLPGDTAAFENYSSYSRGINGVEFDILNPGGVFTTSDFSFRVGNSPNPADWTLAAAPISLANRAGAGMDGSTRVEILWADNAIQNTWLQVTIKGGNGATSGLAADDVFYFGNAIGEAGNDPTSARVDAIDELCARAFMEINGAATAVSIGNPSDYNRDGFVNSMDLAIARGNISSFLNQLQLIATPAIAVNQIPAALAMEVPGSATANVVSESPTAISNQTVSPNLSPLLTAEPLGAFPFPFVVAAPALLPLSLSEWTSLATISKIRVVTSRSVEPRALPQRVQLPLHGIGGVLSLRALVLHPRQGTGEGPASAAALFLDTWRHSGQLAGGIRRTGGRD